MALLNVTKTEFETLRSALMEQDAVFGLIAEAIKANEEDCIPLALALEPHEPRFILAAEKVKESKVIFERHLGE